MIGFLRPASAFVALALLAAATGGSMAQQDGLEAMRALRGLDLARRWCIQCHVVEADMAGDMLTEAPSFVEIANLEDQSAERIEGFILVPHNAMPPLDLRREEISDLTTYILSLRTNPDPVAQ